MFNFQISQSKELQELQSTKDIDNLSKFGGLDGLFEKLHSHPMKGLDVNDFDERTS